MYPKHFSLNKNESFQNSRNKFQNIWATIVIELKPFKKSPNLVPLTLPAFSTH